jgi:ankyrin repeat protein
VLHSAASFYHVDFVRFLVEHGADTSARTKDGWTPLHSASTRHVEGVRFLVEHGADVSAKTKYGSTPLHNAAEMGRVEIARFLVDHGADLSAKNWRGMTPLHLALEKMGSSNHRDVAQFFIERLAAQATPQIQQTIT